MGQVGMKKGSTNESIHLSIINKGWDIGPHVHENPGIYLKNRSGVVDAHRACYDEEHNPRDSYEHGER